MSVENSDHSRIEQGRFLSGRLGTTRRGLTQDVILVDGDPFVHFLDPNGANRSIALPALTSGGDWRIVAHVGSANVLSITDALGSAITSLTSGESVLCFGSTSEWVAFRGYASLGDVFGPAGVGHKVGLVPDPGPTSGLHRFLEDDGTWTSVTTAGIVDAYKIINDGVNSATASGLTSLRIRSSDSSVVLVATNNDPTFGDVVNFTVAPAAVDHDLLLHFVANKHIDHTAVSISTSEGIQGGGDISATRNLKLDYSHLGTATPALTDTVSYFQTATHFKSTWTTINGIFQHNALSGYVANQHVDHSVVSIIAGSGLSGGGDITTSRTLNISYGSLTTTTSPIAADLIAISHSGTMESINFLAFNSALDFNSLLNIGGVATTTALAAEATLARNATNLTSGTVSAARLPTPTASTLGGIESIAAATHKWLNSISTSGVPTLTQPDATDITFTQTGTGAVGSTVNSKLGQILSVKDFGAVGDTTVVTATLTIGSGSPNLLATGAAFTASDVGKVISIPGAAAAGATLATTILTFTDATHVVLAANAGTALTTVSKMLIYGTDNFTALTAAQAASTAIKGGLFWPAGNYLISTSLVLGFSNTRHVNFGGVTITYTGASRAVTFDGAAGEVTDVTFGSNDFPFRINGTAKATNAVYANLIDHSSINVIARDVISGLNLVGGVSCDFFVKVSTNDGGAFILQQPVAGVSSDGQTTACNFHIIVEGISGTGVGLINTNYCTFRGTSEGNVSGGGGVLEQTGCVGNVFNNFDCEANAGIDWTLSGSQQTMLNSCNGSSTSGGIVMNSGTARTQVRGGVFQNITFNSGSTNCFLEYVQCLTTFTDNSATSNWHRVYNGSGVFMTDKAVGAVAIQGTASGAATIQPQSAQGTPTLTLPTGSGTFAVSASSPLAVSAATGNITLTSPLPAANGGTGYTGGAWTTFTPAVTAQTGTFTTVSAAGAFIQIGKWVTFNVSITCTTVGTAAGNAIVQLPVGTAFRNFVTAGVETLINGNTLNSFCLAGSSNLNVRKYDSTTAIVTGAVLTVSGTYETS